MFEVLDKLDSLLTEEEIELMAKFDEVNRLMGDMSIGDSDLTPEQTKKYIAKVSALETAMANDDEELAFRMFITIPKEVLLDAQESASYEYKKALYLGMGVDLDDAIALVVKISDLALELGKQE